ncbi:SAM-dependent methyltransferase [Nocardioides sambongensis]|uniref:SAM-dependent methyltransferase n=1 Tax=Nocardioides sambongensis TaxID=2589074 RepID=UPI00112768D3|nr:cyclopropane-fatty-acyl-phospholipid synthase family protein [Nocardioides sambongensis]
MTATANPALDTDRWPDLTDAPSYGIAARIARRLFRSAIGRLPVTVHLAGGAHGPAEEIGQGGPAIHVHRPDEFFARLGRDQLIGFGEAYMTGAWDEGDQGPDALGDFLEVLAARMARLVPPALQSLRAVVTTRLPQTHRGSRSHTRENVAAHYDLSNDLFALFLDPSLSYSSALFTEEERRDPVRIDEQVFVAAQHRKIDRLLDGAGVGPGTRLLEIGTGWGELAIRAAARGAVVRSITLSVEQRALALERVAAAGVADRVRVDLCDYRELLEEPEAAHAYDAVVSVEMIEAVGAQYWSTYFSTLAHVLAPGGRVALQAITMPDDRMRASKDTHTFITKYIFPGGALPSLVAIEEALEGTGLRPVDDLAIGADYALTLQRWDAAFGAAQEKVLALGFDETFCRMWHFYLQYCRAGFAAGYIDDHQLVFTGGGAR